MEKKTMNKGIIDRIREKKFFEKILSLMEKDDDICYLTCDGLYEGSSIRREISDYHDRIIDVGIAEQNLVGVAAGMALVGMKPIVATMGSFLTLRAYEQIHTDIAYNDLPVKLIGMNCGTSGGTGPTHDSICDLAIMSAIPNMTVIAPSDTVQFWCAIEKTMNYAKPIYFRMPRHEDPTIYKSKENIYQMGGSNVLHFGDDITIIAVGKCVYFSLEASLILGKYGISARVIDMYSVKPIDEKAVISAAKETKRILTIEDHNICGGIGTFVAEIVAKEKLVCQLVKIGIPDEFAVFGSREEILTHYNMDSEGIVNIILKNFNLV